MGDIADDCFDKMIDEIVAEDREWDEAPEPKVQHDALEPSTYELAEAELKSEERKFIRNYEN